MIMSKCFDQAGEKEKSYEKYEQPAKQENTKYDKSRQCDGDGSFIRVHICLRQSV